MLSLIALSFAFDSETQPVLLEDDVELFTGSEYSTGILPAGSPVGVEFAIEADGGAAVSMQGAADLSWPDALTLLFTGETGSGVIILDGALSVVTRIAIDISDWGYEGDFEIDRRSLTFDGSGFFDPFLLDGAATDRVEISDTTDTLQLISYDLEIIAGLGLTFGAEMSPTITVGYEGSYWAADGQLITTEGEPVTLPAEAVADYPVDAIFAGAWDSAFDLVFVGTIDACASLFGCLDLVEFEIPINILTDVHDDEFPEATYTFPLPLLVPALEEANFGSVDVGTLTNLEIPLGNEGNLAVYGTVAVDGSGDFTVYPDQFNANPGTTDGVVVTFAPSGEGDQTANLILTSNDPSRPDLVIPLSGSGYVAPTDIAGDPAEDVIKEQVGGCGCQTRDGAAGGFAGMLLALATVLVGRRR